MPQAATEKKYKRILLKLSGEALTGSENFGIDPRILDLMALEIGQLVGIGVQVGLVVGGGNLFRGAALQSAGLDRVTGDHMGMLATVMNALALRDALERSNIATQVMSSIPMSGVVDHYDRRKAVREAASRFKKIHSYRCAAHDYLARAGGSKHFSLYRRLWPWDHAAGVLLLAEAGGYTARLDGQPYRATGREEGILSVNAPESWERIKNLLNST